MTRTFHFAVLLLIGSAVLNDVEARLVCKPTTFQGKTYACGHLEYEADPLKSNCEMVCEQWGTVEGKQTCLRSKQVCKRFYAPRIHTPGGGVRG